MCGVRSKVGAKLFGPNQTGPEANTTSCNINARSLPGRQSDRRVALIILSSAGAEREQSYVSACTLCQFVM